MYCNGYWPYAWYGAYQVSNNQFELQKTLSLVRESIQDERNDELFYDYLATIAPTEKERSLIIEIRNDEREHVERFRNIYLAFTGENIIPKDLPVEKPASYMEGIQKGIMAENEAVITYNQIFTALPTQVHKNTLMEIIADELRHLGVFNYIYTLNATKEEAED